MASPLILALRRCSARITLQGLVDGMKDLNCQSHQKKVAAACLMDLWQHLQKRAKNSTSGARLTELQKAFKEMVVDDCQVPPPPAPKKRLVSINHTSMAAVISRGDGTTVEVPLYGLPGNATAVCVIGEE
eukprot:4328069-Amphidinium_carterae.1